MLAADIGQLLEIVIYKVSLSIIVSSDRRSSPIGEFVRFRPISKETSNIPTTC